MFGLLCCKPNPGLGDGIVMRVGSVVFEKMSHHGLADPLIEVPPAQTHPAGTQDVEVASIDLDDGYVEGAPAEVAYHVDPRSGRRSRRLTRGQLRATNGCRRAKAGRRTAGRSARRSKAGSS